MFVTCNVTGPWLGRMPAAGRRSLTSQTAAIVRRAVHDPHTTPSPFIGCLEHFDAFDNQQISIAEQNVASANPLPLCGQSFFALRSIGRMPMFECASPRNTRLPICCEPVPKLETRKSCHPPMSIKKGHKVDSPLLPNSLVISRLRRRSPFQSGHPPPYRYENRPHTCCPAWANTNAEGRLQKLVQKSPCTCPKVLYLRPLSTRRKSLISKLFKPVQRKKCPCPFLNVRSGVPPLPHCELG